MEEREERTANLALLYLPLLTNQQPQVRQQACMILLATYGERALTYLRRLLADRDPEIRQQAMRALQVIAEVSGLKVELQPFRGMYIECLGSLRVYLDSREVQQQDWMQLEGGRAGWRKVQGVFAYLIHRGRSGATREELGEAVWDGPVSASSLSRTLTALRQMLAHVGDSTFADRVLVVNRENLLLLPESYHTDVQLFERTFNMACHTENSQGLEAAQPLYAQAMRLYGGPYMADVPRSSDWSQERRDLIMNDFVITAERLAEYAYEQRRYLQCISLCQQALAADPSADDVMAWLLHAYAQLGLRFELEQAYRRYLAASAIDINSPEAPQDTVVQLYQDLVIGRAR